MLRKQGEVSLRVAKGMKEKKIIIIFCIEYSRQNIDKHLSAKQ